MSASMSSLSFAFFEIFDFRDPAGEGASGSSVGPTSLIGDGNPRADSLLTGSGVLSRYRTLVDA